MNPNNTTDYILSQAVIVDSVGGITDISLLIKELNIYEDIFANSISGDAVLIDTMNLPSKLHLHGNEYILIDFKTPEMESYKKTFRLYKISDLTFNNSSSLMYKIFFCSEEFFISHQRRISKSYKGVTNNTIIKDILLNTLKTTKSIDVESTKGLQSIIIPNMMPFEAINWISSFSFNNDLTSAFLFFENKNGFNFKSLSSLFKANVSKQLFVDAKNINQDNLSEDSKFTNRFKIDALNFKQVFNSLETLTTGGYNSKMLKLDLFNQKHEEIQFDFITNKSGKLNDFPNINDATNRFEDQLFDASSYYRYFGSFQGDLVDKWLLQRASQFSLLNSERFEIQIAGDSKLKCGDLIYVDFPDITPSTSGQDIVEDPYKSGVYIIASIRHRIFETKYVNIIQLLKDSNKGQLPLAMTGTVYDTVKKQ